MNPLLNSNSQNRQFDDAFPFQDLRTDHFEPAFTSALETARKNLAAIADSESAPTFANTLDALEAVSEDLDRVSSIFGNLLHAHTSPELQTLAKAIMPKLSEFSNDITLNEPLFKKIQALFQTAGQFRYTQEQSELLKKTYRHFVQNGALLDADGKKSLRKIDESLSLLGREFADNLLEATQSFSLPLVEPNALAGLPEWLVSQCHAAGESKGISTPCVTLDAPLFVPFMKFSDRRDLREKLWRAYQGRARESNSPVLAKIAAARLKRARLLGFATHANYVLMERMAENPTTVLNFLSRLEPPSRKAAIQELAEIKEFAQTAGLEGDLQKWDLSYYSEKLKEKKFHFQEERIRAYFPLEAVVKGVFDTASRLYGIQLVPRKDIPVYHPDVEVFEVREPTPDGAFHYLGLLYTDFYPRPSKQGGAWMSHFRDQGTWSGSSRRAHISIVCNLTKPDKDRPSLLDLNEVRTLFHEFGHALHGLLSECHYRSMGGTNVFWDFVELPSQIMENWTREEESLRLFSRHYKTGEPLPIQDIKTLQAVSKFQTGLASLRQLHFGILDMAWHFQENEQNLNLSTPEQVESFERSALDRFQIMPWVDGTAGSPGFSHIFSGGYSAGYYSYKWAEVLEADAFEYFKENGIYSTKVAQSFRREILSRGGTAHPAELYRNFRGRDPDVSALLRRDGLI